MYEYVFYFVIYAFLGWCTEVAYKAVTVGQFVNRGFLNGPGVPDLRLWDGFCDMGADAGDR